jgi:hypothetical protein
MKDIFVKYKGGNEMEEMIQMMLGGIVKELISKNVHNEVKGYEMEVDTEMEYPIDDECILKMKLKGSVKMEHAEIEITNKDTNKIVNNYGLKEEA